VIFEDLTEQADRPIRELLDELVSDAMVDQIMTTDLDTWLDMATELLDLGRRHLAQVPGNPDPAEAAYHMRLYLVANAIGQLALGYAAVWQAYEEETFGVDAEQWGDDDAPVN